MEHEVRPRVPRRRERLLRVATECDGLQQAGRGETLHAVPAVSVRVRVR